MLFLIVVEELNRVVLEARRQVVIKGLKLGKSLFLTHLFFVEDVLLFCDGSRRDASKLKEILDLYCTATGMRVNLQTSSISFNGVKDDQKRDLC